MDVAKHGDHASSCVSICPGAVHLDTAVGHRGAGIGTDDGTSDTVIQSSCARPQSQVKESQRRGIAILKSDGLYCLGISVGTAEVSNIDIPALHLRRNASV